VAARNHARKAGGTIGAIAGAASSFSCAMKGAQAGYRLGMSAGPTGMAIGTITGAILGGLLGGAAGCSAGIALGELVDDKLLNNYRCLDCTHTFGHISTRPADTSSPFTSAHVEAENPWFDPSDADEPLHERHF
jgi:hypothetical protein